MKAQFTVRLSYSEIFDEQIDIENLTSNINIIDGIKTLSYINLIDYKFFSSDGFELKFILNEWLINSSKELKHKILSSYSKEIFREKQVSNDNLDFSRVKIINKLTTLRTLQLLINERTTIKKRLKTRLALKTYSSFI